MRIFFAFMVFWLGLFTSVQAQNAKDIQWFDSLFVPKPLKNSIEEELRLLQSNQQVANENHDRNGEAKAMIAIATFQLTRLKNYGQALNWLMRSMSLEDTFKLNRERVFTFITITKVYEEVGDFNRGVDILSQAKTQIPKDDYELLILILNEEGRIKAKLGAIDDAIENYHQMLSYARLLELRDKEGDALFQLGQLLGIKKEYEKALKNHRDALTIRRENQNKKKEAQSLSSVGQLYLLQKNFERSKANHDVALKISQQLKDSLGIIESYNNIGELYFSKKDYKQAIKNLNLALSKSHKIEALEQTLKAHENLSLCYRELQDFKSALHHRELQRGISDMIQREKAQNELLEIENKYAIERKQNEIQKLADNVAEGERIIAEQNRERIFFILIMSLGAVIGALILYLYFVIRRSNRKLKEINETKDKLFSIIGHDLKGPLNSLTAFSSLLIHHAETLTKEEIKMLSGDVDKSLKNLFALLENLLEWARSQTGNIDFKPVSFDLAAILKENKDLLTPLAQKKNITLLNEDGAKLPVRAHKHSINTVVRNLISNAIKFTPTGGKIAVTTELEGKLLKVIVTDNGVGISKEALKRLFKLGTKHSTLGTSQEKGTGLGLILCKDFIEKNGGTIGVESEEGKGSRFYFTVPVGILEEKATTT